MGRSATSRMEPWRSPPRGRPPLDRLPARHRPPRSRRRPPPRAPPPPPPSAPPPPPRPPAYYPVRRYYDPTAFRHVGFFLRFDLGLGYLGSSTSASATGLNFDSARGVAGELGLAVGGALRENLILSGHFWVAAAASPTLTK